MSFVSIGGHRLEYERIDSGNAAAPTVVMLHEGLGSVSLWKDFPQQLARASGCNVVAYSRHGYGRSTPLEQPRTPQYMHDEALSVLPRFLDALDIRAPILFGHSDGASIALIHAGGSGRAVAGVVALAPHVFVEELSVRSIAAAKVAYETTDLREKLARYHDDAEGAFRGWNDIWLSAAFRDWNIEQYLPGIRCPVLVIQGADDEYGTMEQIRRIERDAPRVESLCLPDCRHSPHRDQPQYVLAAVVDFLTRVSNPDLTVLQRLPRDADGPVFAAPWQACVFALAVHLSQQQHFTWAQWTETLGQELRASTARGEPDDGSRYYHCWLAALERLVIERHLSDATALHALQEAWAEAFRRTPHGQPVMLSEAVHSNREP